MVIGLDLLLERIRRGELVTGLSDRELTSPEGAGFDLRVGELYRIKSGGFLGVTNRETSHVELIETYSASDVRRAILRPNEYYLVKIIESIRLDADMLAFFHPRSTLFRSGIVLQTGVHPPGYHGAPTFGLYVAGQYSFDLEMGARIAHVNFFRIEGASSPYRGQWQGGRVATEGPEPQR